MASLSSPLTLEDLPDDLLQHALRGPSSHLTLKDIASFGLCSRRLWALVVEGGLRKLKVTVEDPTWDPPPGGGAAAPL
jgi:hypothetical protein